MSEEGESQYFLAEGVAGEGSRPDWFVADKYQTVSDQAKAYAEADKSRGDLTNKIGEMSGKLEQFEKFSGFVGAPEEYEVSLPEGVKIETDHPMFASAKEWAKGKDLNQESFNELVGLYSAVKAAEDQSFEEMYSSEKAKIENFDAREKNIDDFLKANDMGALASVATTQNEFEALEKLLELAGKSTMDVGNNTGAGVPTDEEIDALMFEKDEYDRTIYSYDKERRAKVQAMIERKVGKGDNVKLVG